MDFLVTDVGGSNHCGQCHPFSTSKPLCPLPAPNPSPTGGAGCHKKQAEQAVGGRELDLSRTACAPALGSCPS